MSNLINVDDGTIADSMKKVFEEELKDINKELNEIYKELKVKNIKELQTIISIENNKKDKEEKIDLEKLELLENKYNIAKELEQQKEKVQSYLRELNLRTIK